MIRLGDKVMGSIDAAGAPGAQLDGDRGLRSIRQSVPTAVAPQPYTCWT